MTEVHHLRGRGGPDPHRVGPDVFGPGNNLAGLCRRCHDYIEQNRAWAYANGWLRRRNGKADDDG